jgi:CO dehydrogenase maturation factor
MALFVFSGKGGTGKTTLSALAIRHFAERGELTLALDFDPDAHLYKMLGMGINRTIGEMVDRIHLEKKAELEPKKPVDVSDQEYFFSLIAAEVLMEGDGYDLVTLGRPFGDIDCYCPTFLWSEYAVTNLMKSYGRTYQHVVVDCDPGTEIFPRRALDAVAHGSCLDHLLLVLDGSRMSLDTAHEIIEESVRRNLCVKHRWGILNRINDDEFRNRILQMAEECYGFCIAGCIPDDPGIRIVAQSGGSINTISESPAYEAMQTLMSTLCHHD